MLSSDVLEQELASKYLQFFDQNMELSFRVSFHKSLLQPKSFSLDIIIFAFKTQTE